MKDNNLSRIFLLIPLCFASVVVSPPTAAFHSVETARSVEVATPKIANRKTSKLLIAQNDGSGAGSITPEKIRIVVYEKLRQNWRAPSAADGAKAVIRFTVMKSGQLSGEPSLRASAGVPEFDQACIDAAERVAPFPPLPSYLSDIVFIATFYAGKAPWVELALDSERSSSGTSTGGSTQGSSTGQSGWTQPSGGSSSGDAATALPALGQSGWTQPSPSGSDSNQSAWTQPSGSSNSTGQPSASADTGELQAQPLGLVSAASNSGKPPANKTAPPTKTPPSKNQPKSVPSSPTGSDSAKKPNTVSSNQKVPLKQPQGQVTPGQNSNPSAGQQPPKNVQIPPSQPQQTDMTGSQDLSQRVVLLNNNAVVAIADNNYEVAIKKLEEALKIDPTYQQARTNLAIAYNNYGLQLKDRPDEAIKVFHKAFALDPGNEKTKVNLDTIIQYMGKNPKVFKDRLDLGNKALAQGDRLGARIEYEAALLIKPDPIIQQKLYAIINGAPPPPQGGVNTPQSNPGTVTGRPAGTPVSKPPAKPVHHAVKPTTANTGGSTKPPDGTSDGGSASVSQKLDTMYRNIKDLELKTFGKPFESDDVLTRLSRLEQKLLGKVQQGKPMRRLDALLILQ